MLCFVFRFVLFSAVLRMVLLVLVAAFFLVVSVVALPLLLLLTTKPPPGPPKPPPEPPKTKQKRNKTQGHFSLILVEKMWQTGNPLGGGQLPVSHRHETYFFQNLGRGSGRGASPSPSRRGGAGGAQPPRQRRHRKEKPIVLKTCPPFFLAASIKEKSPSQSQTDGPI